MSTPDRTVELPDHGFVSVSMLTGTEAGVSPGTVTDDITLTLGRSVRIPLSPDSWAVIIPELVAALPADLRDDVVNTIIETADGVTA